MANKYIRHGETYNGDGTSSAAATSNGGVGAWNTIDYFTGTTPAYGSIAAGDTIYIRSKDASGADISLNATVNKTIGSTAATSGSWITWIIDNGEVWPGIDGTITYENSVYNVSISTTNQYNEFICKTRGSFRVIKTGGSSLNYALFGTAGGVIDGFYLDWQGLTGGGRTNLGGGSFSPTVYKNLIIKAGNRTSPVFNLSVNTQILKIINLDIELFNNAHAVFAASATGSHMDVYGGRIYGSAAAGCQLVSTGYPININGLSFPKTMLLSTGTRGVSITGHDETTGAARLEDWGVADTRPTAGNYPYLNATLPNSTAQGWSWKVYPSTASRVNQLRFPVSTESYQETSATKTLRLEMLIENAAYKAKCDKSNLWVEWHYIDSTGEAVMVSTQGTGALSDSTAGWNADYYGSTTFDKVKFEATTPTAIAQDTMIVTVLCGTIPSGSVDEYMFVCPSIQIS